MLGRALLFTGLALIAATAVRAVFDLIQSNPGDAWVFVFAVGCVAASIGAGMTREPWRLLQDLLAKFER
jgi:hypothetical protein